MKKKVPKSGKTNYVYFESLEYFGHLGGSVVEHLLLAQVMILESWDPVLHRAHCRESASPSAYVSAFSVSLMNK